MKLSSHIAFLLQLTAVSAATTKVIRKRSVGSTRSLSDSFNKQQEYLAKLQEELAKNRNAVVASARHGSGVSAQCFVDTVTEYGFDEYVTEEPDCTGEGSSIICDYSSIGLTQCTDAGGTIVRDSINYCEENFIAESYPFCVAPSCDNDVTYTQIMVDWALPATYAFFGGEEIFMMTLEEFIAISGFGTCPSTPSSKAPKSSKSPSSKTPKSSKSPSSKAPKMPSSKAPKTPSPSSKTPKSSKSPSSKAPKAPSSKAPKATKTPKATAAPASTKAPKSTKSPGAAASSSATASMSAASVAAGALVWFSL